MNLTTFICKKVDLPTLVSRFFFYSHFSSLHILNMTNGVSHAKAGTIKLRSKKSEPLKPMDIKVFEPMRQNPNGTSACAKNNGGCSHLCLAAENDQKFSCSCPRGIQLIDQFNCANDTQSLLILSVRTGIRKISLDTDDFSDVTGI